MRGLLSGDAAADRVVPPTGFTAGLTIFSAAAMAFLAVFSLALSVAAGRLADRWSESLARTATIRISAPAGQMQAQTDAVMAVLITTPGIKDARALTREQQYDLLAPWFGPDLPLERLPLPQLIEIVESEEGFDADGLRLRLAAEAPGAVLDDHSRWRQPLISAASRLRTLGAVAILLIGMTTAAMITLSARAALAANSGVIHVLRLVGARDAYIVRAFVRRFTGRALQGALAGTLLGMIGVALLPGPDVAGGFLTGLGFHAAGWLLPLLIPPLTGVVAFWATRLAAIRVLGEFT